MLNSKCSWIAICDMFDFFSISNLSTHTHFYEIVEEVVTFDWLIVFVINKYVWYGRIMETCFVTRNKKIGINKSKKGYCLRLKLLFMIIFKFSLYYIMILNCSCWFEVETFVIWLVDECDRSEIAFIIQTLRKIYFFIAEKNWTNYMIYSMQSNL